MRSSRIAALAFAADAVAVVVFAAIGRSSHGESGDVLGLLGTAAPFLVGLCAGWATPIVRRRPAGVGQGVLVLGATVGIGLLVRAGFGGGIPPIFALISLLSLGLLLVGWRALSLAVANRAGQHVR